MRRLIKILVSLVVLFILAAILVPFLVPADKFKGEVLAQIKTKTGREVSIDHLSFALFPTLSLDADNVKIGNPTWISGNMVEAKTLKIGLELLPLLHKQVQLKELTLDTPVIALIQQNGRANWDFGNAPTTNHVPAPTKQAAEKSPASSTGAMLAGLHLGKITIKNGTVSFKDITGKTQTVTGINLSITAPNLLDRAEVEFSALYNGKKAELSLKLQKPFAFESGAPTDVDLKVVYGDF